MKHWRLGDHSIWAWFDHSKEINGDERCRPRLWQRPVVVAKWGLGLWTWPCHDSGRIVECRGIMPPVLSIAFLKEVRW